jgi:ribosome-binding protein aMBF1 (putative translation factor)
MSKPAKLGRPPGRRAWDFNREAAISARLARGWSRGDLSKRCDEMGIARVHDSNIVKYERGDICPSPMTLKAIAAALDLNTDDLIVIGAAA